MKNKFEDLIDFINSNIRFGSEISQRRIDYWFELYPIEYHEKFLIYNELESLNIKVTEMPKEKNKAQVYILLECIKHEQEIEDTFIEEWFKNNNIHKQDQALINESLSKRTKVIKKQKNDYELDLEFLDGFELDLDEFLESDQFKEKKNSLEDVIDKSYNMDYLSDLKIEDNTQKNKALSNIVKANEGLVRKIVNYYSGFKSIGFDEDDMYNVGVIGMMKAAEKFDVSSGYAFSTYAIWWIRQGITRGIADFSTTIRIPVHRREEMNKLRRIDNELWNRLARPATNSEIAREMEISNDKVEELQFYISQSNLASLDKPIGNEQNSFLGEFIKDDKTPTPHELFFKSERREVIEDILSTKLTDREQQIIMFRFGLNDDGEGMTLEEVGKIFGVTRERIRQIEAKAIRRLRHHKTSRVLKEYLYEY